MSLRAEIAAATRLLLAITDPQVHEGCTTVEGTADQTAGSLIQCQPSSRENEGEQQ